MTPNAFITFEGIEGCGKSTQSALLKHALEAAGEATLSTREPGGTALAERIRDLILSGAPGDMTAETELLLYLAARQDHVAHRIRPALAAGTWVVCDRFADATIAYQGHARDLDLDQVTTWVNATRGLAPDLTLLLDLPVSEGLQRAHTRGEINRFEAEDPDFHQQVRDGYLALARAEPERIAVIDGSGAPEEVHERVIAAVNAHLKTRLASPLSPAPSASP